MTLNVFSATDPDDLLNRAADLLQSLPSGEDPLRVRWVVQPGRLWERALRRKLADDGIAAGLEFGSLRLTLERVLRLACPEVKLQGEEHLFWSLVGLLNKDPAVILPGSAPAMWLEAHAKGGELSLDRIQLARMLAGILDDHATHRPAEVHEWLKGSDTKEDGDVAWIATLARGLWGNPAEPRPLALQLGILNGRLQKAGEICGLPSRLVAVLAGAQPAVYLETLGLMARVCPVDLLVLQTCDRGRSDEITTWKELRLRWKAAGKRQDLMQFAEEQKWVVPGTLQAFWGKAGITLQQQLVDLEERLAGVEIEWNETEPEAAADSTSSALAILQSDIRETREARRQEELIAWPAAEKSLFLLDAPSPLRELEGARECIRAALEQDKSLQPADILLVLADVEHHGPLLPAVFGSSSGQMESNAPDGLSRIPWHLADRSLRADSDAVAALQDLLAALVDRITLPVVAGLLAQPAIQARLGYSAGDAASLVDYLDQASFRWGLTKEDRQNQPGAEDGMWTLDFALRRLVAGLAMPDGLVDPVGPANVVPLPGYEGLGSASLANFVEWAEKLGKACQSFTGDRSLAAWLAWLNEWIPQLMETGGERDGQSVWIARVVRSLSEGAGQVDADIEFSWAAFVALFAETLAGIEQELPLGRGIGGMTVASPRMARLLPAKMLVVVGLSDGAWPRQDPARQRGLLKSWSPGDRMRRDDDRLVAMEWVLSAKSALVWTWQGRHEQTGKDIPPSVVVGELADTLRSVFTKEKGAGLPFIQKLPLHAFDPESLARRSLYDTVAVAAANQLRNARASQELLQAPEGKALAFKEDDRALPDLMEFALAGAKPDGWGAAQWKALASYLIAFWKLPCAAYLKRIGIQTGDEYEMLPDREALKIGALDAWKVRDQLLQVRLESQANGEAGAVQARLKYAGQLSPGQAGEQAFKGWVEEVNKVAEKASAPDGGSVEYLYGPSWLDTKGVVYVTASEPKDFYLLRARIGQLVLATMYDHEVACSLCGKGGKVVPVTPVNPSEALLELQRLTAFALLGQTFPLPFFPKASSALVEKEDPAAAAELFWNRGFNDEMEPESKKPACQMVFRGMDPLELGLPLAPEPDDGRWNDLVAVAGLHKEVPLFPQVSSCVFAFCAGTTKPVKTKKGGKS